MFKISTFLETNEGDESYVSLDDSLKLRGIFEHRKFTPEHIQMRITIKYNNQIVVGVDVPSGLDLWSDYMVAIEQYLESKNVERFYGIDPYLMKLVSINNNLVDFSIVGDWEPVEVIAQAVLPEKEFLKSILDGAEHFWGTLIKYKVFEEKELRKTTSKEEPKLMIEEIEKLREKVKILFN